VRFEYTAPRRFDLVVGADGLHSTVRRLVFGDESRFTTATGAHLGVVVLPRECSQDGELFRGASGVPARDPAAQKEPPRTVFAGMHADVDRWLGELDRTPAFYFDSIAQLHMPTWSRGRVTLVGDAGYCPGPAVGGSTSLAVVGAYVLAGELARAGGDHEPAFPAYERAMAGHVRGSREAATSAAKSLVPTSRLGVRGLAEAARLVSALPAAPGRALLRLTSRTARVHDAIAVGEY